MNNIVRVCMRKLNLVMIRRDYYDPDAAISINVGLVLKLLQYGRFNFNYLCSNTT